jgi:DNA repair protein RadD
MTLRPYQQEAHDAAWQHVKGSIDPCLIEAATGAGKSHIIAALAHTIHDHTGKRVLCLAPSAELVTQNREKFLATGNKASMFSASAGAKELRHPVVFGSPLTVKNRISRFTSGYAAVIVDEAHGLTPTLKSIIEAMRKESPMLRVIGTTATPYRLNEGYIFSIWTNDRVNDDSTTREPYFTKLVSRITAPQLISMGFLTPPTVGSPNAQGYDTGNMKLNSRGQFDKEDVDRAYNGKGRLTSEIVADVIDQCRYRNGVLFFAATVQHAQEVMESLPPQLSAIVTGSTPKKERDNILRRFKAQEIKYLVNVAVLTTGFDAPHVDCIAILRKTESAGLWTQIMGRGLRLHEGKRDCLVLDYTTNIDDHFPDGDLFDPKIEAKRAKGKGDGMEAECPECGYENMFTPNPEYEDYRTDAAGYCVDLNGVPIMTDYGPLPAHYGRRCFGMHKTGPKGKYERCTYRWTSKECPKCQEPNDLSARYCIKCKAEIVDPNEKLAADFKRIKKDPTQVQTDEVTSMDLREGVSQAGNRTVRADFVTPWRSFSVWFVPESRGWKQRQEWANFQAATENGPPRTVTYRKDPESGFYRLLGLNKEPDREPEKPSVSSFWEQAV